MKRTTNKDGWKDVTENKFNLVDEPWIPLTGFGLASLRDAFSGKQAGGLGGTPVRKIAVLKFLLAIAQAACTPETEEEWKKLDVEDVSSACLAYLEKWRDAFWLFGEKPFLQMPEIAKATVMPFGALDPEKAAGNTTVLTDQQRMTVLSDSEKALLLIQLMGFATGGKKTDNSLVLTPGYKGKSKAGKAGSALGYLGFLHSFPLGSSLRETVWLNLMSRQVVDEMKVFTEGVGVAPWEKMPVGEDCTVARSLKKSLMGRLIPLSRFCYLVEDGIHYSEGIAHDGYKEGMADPSVSVNYNKTRKVIWTDPEKRPWRFLPAMLSFLGTEGIGEHFSCPQVRIGVERARAPEQNLPKIFVWSGGLRVSGNAGEQYVSGADDYVDSQIELECDELGKPWFMSFSIEMGKLEELAKSLYGAVTGYCKEMKLDGSGKAARASHEFWQLAEGKLPELLEMCQETKTIHTLRGQFAMIAKQIYDRHCPHEIPRQMTSWVKHRLNTGKYMNSGSEVLNGRRKKA